MCFASRAAVWMEERRTMTLRLRFYNRDRLGYTQPVGGADQKPEFG